MSIERVYDFFKKSPTYFLGTMDGMQCQVRPFGTMALVDGKLYIQTGRKKDAYSQMVQHPRIAICGWDGKGQWVRISATAIEDPSVEAQAKVLDCYPELKAMYAAGDGNTAVFFLVDGEAHFCSFTAPEEVVKF
ncbi:MAG: pyridoxamine 5'-phosphate oxidase family protein [Eggerthellaceae bacterium]|nr:pyridoxamine 5'-phosphate oxidase family protein [Eggerthellaceae bacterium]